MTGTVLLPIAVVLAGFFSFLLIVHTLQRRASDQKLRAFTTRQPILRFRHWIIAGTDADLKLEFLFLAYQSLLVGSAHWFNVTPRRLDWLLAVIACFLGFHFRQWLSKWRLRNIVSLKIVSSDQYLYFKGATDISAILLNVLVSIHLSLGNPIYAVLQFLGFFIHEVVLESRKGERLLKRKLYLFDLDDLPVRQAVREKLIHAIRRFRLSAIGQLIRQSQDRREAVLLDAFRSLLRDDFSGFRSVVDRNDDLIQADPSLLYYFGKAFYNLGELERAKEYLRLGRDEHQSRLCAAYYALTLLAEAEGRQEVQRVLELLEPHVQVTEDSKSDMFLAAYYSLALAISTGKYPDPGRERIRRAFAFIHEALRINETYLRKAELGELQIYYYRANEQIFLDIYGYILYRMGNDMLSFRVLEDAIASDDTYPWPYFHLALLYLRIGRRALAGSLLYRIAANERSDTVLKRLCVSKLKELGETTL